MGSGSSRSGFGCLCAEHVRRLVSSQPQKRLPSGTAPATASDAGQDQGAAPGPPLVEFVDVAPEGKILVTILSLTGANIKAAADRDVSVGVLKSEVASKLGLQPTEFRLVHHASALLCAETSIGALAGERGDALQLYIVKVTSLERHEAVSLTEWHELAATLQNFEIDDEIAHGQLSSFLDKYPAMINLQMPAAAGEHFKPLLAFAIEGAPSTDSRQRCVDELLRRGARVHIRHRQGYLLEQAKASDSAFIELLQNKNREFAAHESAALKAWRGVSSKLCGETIRPVHDEEAMSLIVRRFCEAHPEMVNFQNNHAANLDGHPHGYFGYAPLIAFAGAAACRRRRGGDEEDTTVRQGSVQELLRHGARMDMQHGGKTTLEWMEREGSLLIPWLQIQLSEPVPEQASFEFVRS